MKVVASCTIQGDTFVIAPPGQLFAEVGLSDGLNEDTDAGLLSSALVEISCGFASTNFLSPLHTGDKVEFNTVNFVESRQSQLCGFGPVHTGNKVDRIGNKVHRDKLSNSPRCRFVAKTSNKVEYIGNKVERIRKQLTLLPVLATVDFQHSRPCWIQLCHQCVPGFRQYKTIHWSQWLSRCCV